MFVCREGRIVCNNLCILESQLDFYFRKNVLVALWRWVEEGKNKDLKMNYEITGITLIILVKWSLGLASLFSSATVERPESLCNKNSRIILAYIYGARIMCQAL